jgi:hypothetical protein
MSSDRGNDRDDCPHECISRQDMSSSYIYVGPSHIDPATDNLHISPAAPSIAVQHLQSDQQQPEGVEARSNDWTNEMTVNTVQLIVMSVTPVQLNRLARLDGCYGGDMRSGRGDGHGHGVGRVSAPSNQQDPISGNARGTIA